MERTENNCKEKSTTWCAFINERNVSATGPIRRLETAKHEMIMSSSNARPQAFSAVYSSVALLRKWLTNRVSFLPLFIVGIRLKFHRTSSASSSSGASPFDGMSVKGACPVSKQQHVDRTHRSLPPMLRINHIYA